MAFWLFLAVVQAVSRLDSRFFMDWISLASSDRMTSFQVFWTASSIFVVFARRVGHVAEKGQWLLLPGGQLGHVGLLALGSVHGR